MRLSTTFALTVLFTASFAIAPVASAAEPSSTSSVEQIRASASEGSRVSLQGHVVSSRNSRIFELEDDAGERILVVIPNYLQRELGTPGKGETIRVSGKYDHKTFLGQKQSSFSDPDKTWGIRAASLERNVWTDGRNPNPADAAHAQARPSRSSAPAAPSNLATLAGPKASVELKERLSSARQRVLAARKASERADAAHAGALYREADSDEIESLLAAQQQAQAELDTAIAAVSPLVEEARAAGTDEAVIDMYEAGITKPKR